MKINIKLLKETRINNRYSQQQIADLIKVSRRAYNSWENGKNVPLISHIEKLEELFKIKLREVE